MARQYPQTSSPLGALFALVPVRLVAAGIAASLLAAVLNGLAAQHWVEGGFATFLRVLLFVSGLLLAGGGVWWQLRSAGLAFEERARSALMVAAADAAVLASYLATDKAWDSLRLALVVLWVVGLLTVPLLLLPSFGRRIAVSVLVVLHFGGILTAVTAVELPNGTVPWVTTTLWARVYRPYLSFMYLNNAYHFYSPEPGPPTLVWFLIEYDNGERQWLKLVNREECVTRLEYQRLLALTESTNRPQNTSLPKLGALAKQLDRAARKKGIELPPEYYSNLPAQYREPTADAKRYIASYARHVARTVLCEKDPDARVKRVKVYRIVHQLINAPQLQLDVSPIDPVLYYPYFQGEFDAEGKLLTPGNLPNLAWVDTAANGTPVPRIEKGQDPFLYWFLPIYRRPLDPSQPAAEVKLGDMRLIDTLGLHAGFSTGLEEKWKQEQRKR